MPGIICHLYVVSFKYISCVKCRICKGQGGKICPYTNMKTAKTPHSLATRDNLRERLELEKRSRRNQASPSARVFQKTSSLWAAFSKNGCGGPLDEKTLLTEPEQTVRDKWNSQIEASRRGHEPNPTCQGRLVMEYNALGKAFVRQGSTYE